MNSTNTSTLWKNTYPFETSLYNLTTSTRDTRDCTCSDMMMMGINDYTPPPPYYRSWRLEWHMTSWYWYVWHDRVWQCHANVTYVMFRSILCAMVHIMLVMYCGAYHVTMLHNMLHVTTYCSRYIGGRVTSGKGRVLRVRVSRLKKSKCSPRITSLCPTSSTTCNN